MNTTFKEAQRIQSKKIARSKKFNRVPTEDQEQMTVMSWAHRTKFKDGRLSDYLFHIPNGGSRNIIEATKLKKMGVKAGVPDLQLIVPNGEVHGLWIELKAQKGKLQPSQKIMIQRLEAQGYMCKVCFGADEAINEIKKYLMLEAA
ncbi:VRR-NUC domain-containing protein [Acinetobacter ursingii]|uniref:VRR-NUC domain-containing protein n=1 Tax=Acinetobacter ursingii TaxID=108980 RepID=UPI00124C639A|nr:VRR-NUC domain-containing protein [Acinetobacter ursingii]